MSITLDGVLRDWNSADIGNLCVLLEGDTPYTTDGIKQRLKWLYHSRAGAGAESAVRNITRRLVSRISKTEPPTAIDPDELREMPTYDDLLLGACRHLKVLDDNASLQDHEMHLCHAIIVGALQRMTPRQRVSFFNQHVDVSGMAREARIGSPILGGSAPTLLLLGVAQASGFGVYIASTTALGFVTHAVGISLPFAVYTGLTSTIAFVIGPAGWLAAGIWAAWKLTQPSWRRLIPGLVYIISTNSHRRHLIGNT